jgi:hypothetical protein
MNAEIISNHPLLSGQVELDVSRGIQQTGVSVQPT